MEKLTIEHLAPYLPYGLTVLFNNEVYEVRGMDDVELALINIGWVPIENAKPILRPLSDLHLIFNDFVNVMPYGDEYKSHLFLDEIKHTEKTDLFIIKSTVCSELIINKSQPLTAPYLAIQVMLKNHFDVFDLISQGLAIDINTIKP